VPGPPVSALSLRGCHASCHKGADRPRVPTAPTPRQPTMASPCALLTSVVRSRAPLSATDRTCLSAPRHRRRLAAPAASTLVTAEPRVPERRPRLAVHAAATAVYPVWTPPLPTPPGKLWCHRLRRAAVHVPVRPRRALPRAAYRALVTSPSWSTSAAPRAAPGQAGPGRGPRARCVGRGGAGPGWAAHPPCKRAAPILCNWAAADSAQ
jgi:hypothetical protein